VSRALAPICWHHDSLRIPGSPWLARVVVRSLTRANVAGEDGAVPILTADFDREISVKGHSGIILPRCIVLSVRL
jgi:hypothetical protein